MIDNNGMIVVAVLHYGNAQNTIKCLESVFKTSSDYALPSRVIIPSNGTARQNDIIASWLRTKRKSFVDVDLFFEDKLQNDTELQEAQCILIRNEKNLGFAAGYNPAIKLAVMQGAEAIWLLNNDTIVHSGALSSLANCYQRTGGRSVIGTTVVSSNDSELVQCAGGMFFNPYLTSVTSSLSGKNIKNVDQVQSPDFDYIYGASMLIPAQAFRDVGLLNEDFFLFYEEIDFCRRAKSAGYSLKWCKEAVVQHYDASEKGNSEIRIFHDVRSFTLFARRHYPISWFLLACVHMIGRCGMQIKEKNFKAALVAVKGLLQGINDAMKNKLVS